MARLALPNPQLDGALSVEQAIARRRSRRDLLPGALTLQELAQVLWAAQGVTDKQAGKPSLGGGHASAGRLRRGGQGRRGRAGGRRLPLRARRTRAGRRLCRGRARRPDGGRAGPVVPGRRARHPPGGRRLRPGFERYGQRGARYVDMEAGHAGQNVLLQAESLALAAVGAGAFRDAAVAQVFRLPSEHVALYLVSVGHARGRSLSRTGGACGVRKPCLRPRTAEPCSADRPQHGWGREDGGSMAAALHSPSLGNREA